MMNRIALRRVHMRRIYEFWNQNIWSAMTAEQIRRDEDARIMKQLLEEFGLKVKDATG